MSQLFVLVVLAAIFACFSSALDLDGAIVGARLRCQGYLCPQWALDIGRYDYERAIGQEYQYVLQELLPLGPTAQRSMPIYTSYDADSRLYTVVASNYPEDGIDTFWASTINNDITGTTPVISNLMVPHPDASPNNPGKLALNGLYALPKGRTIAVFNDGCMFDIDTANQRYIHLGNLFSEAGTGKFTVTHAHIADGNTLKSFIKDDNGNSYLVKTDFSSSPVKVGAALKVNPPRGQLGQETPMAAFMYSVNGATPQLLVQSGGNFDTFAFVDETTGDSTSIIASLSDSQMPSVFQCDEGTKDCDYWQTACLDPVSNKIYFQAHAIDSDGNTFTAGIYDLFYSKAGAPLINPAMSPMQFGYMGYQFVNMKN